MFSITRFAAVGLTAALLICGPALAESILPGEMPVEPVVTPPVDALVASEVMVGIAPIIDNDDAQGAPQDAWEEPSEPWPMATLVPVIPVVEDAVVATRDERDVGYRTGDTITVTVTHYCPCAKCNGADNVGMAANGQRLKSGMAALNWLPLRSIVEVNGKRYTITDRGVGTGRIDIYVTSHARAYELGKFKTKLTIIRIGK